MKSITKRVLILHQELDELCESMGIQYFCGGLIPKSITDGSMDLLTHGQIFVMPQDLEKIFLAMNNNCPEQRALEYIGNNPDFPTISLHYVDTSTTVYTASRMEPWLYHSVYIDIIPLIDKKKMSKIYSYWIQAISMNNRAYKSKYYNGKRYRPGKIFRRMYAKKDDTSRDKLFFSLLKSFGESESNRDLKALYLEIDSIREITVSRDIYGKVIECELCDYLFCIPERINQWYDMLYPKRDRKRKFPEHINQYTVCSCEIPWEEMKQNLYNEPDVSAEIALNKSIISKTSKRIKARQHRIEEVWQYAKKLYKQARLEENE